jgi:cytochrome c556
MGWDIVMQSPWVLSAVAVAVALPLAAAAPADPTAEQIIAARQASLDMSSITLAEMKEAAKGGKDPKTQVYYAAALAKWAGALPTLFPAGTGAEAGVPTRAKPEIWTDRAGFDQRAAEYRTAVERLRDLARAGDADGFKAQVQTVDMACDACHDTYKVQPAASPKAAS